MPGMLYCWKGIGGTASNACIGSNLKGLRCSVTLGVLKVPKKSSIFGLATGGDASRSSIEEVLGPNETGSLAKGSKNVDGGAVTVDLDGSKVCSTGACALVAGMTALSEGLISKKSKRSGCSSFLPGRDRMDSSL